LLTLAAGYTTLGTYRRLLTARVVWLVFLPSALAVPPVALKRRPSGKSGRTNADFVCFMTLFTFSKMKQSIMFQMPRFEFTFVI
jgi:hypothetical protein